MRVILGELNSGKLILGEIPNSGAGQVTTVTNCISLRLIQTGNSKISQQLLPYFHPFNGTFVNIAIGNLITHVVLSEGDLYNEYIKVKSGLIITSQLPAQSRFYIPTT